MKNILVLTEHDELVPNTYHEIIRELERAGAGIPEGRTHHIASLKESGPGMMLLDEFDTLDNFNQYHERWRSVLAKRGIAAPPFKVYRVERKQHTAIHAYAESH